MENTSEELRERIKLKVIEYLDNVDRNIKKNLSNYQKHRLEERPQELSSHVSWTSDSSESDSDEMPSSINKNLDVDSIVKDITEKHRSKVVINDEEDLDGDAFENYMDNLIKHKVSNATREIQSKLLDSDMLDSQKYVKTLIKKKMSIAMKQKYNENDSGDSTFDDGQFRIEESDAAINYDMDIDSIVKDFLERQLFKGLNLDWGSIEKYIKRWLKRRVAKATKDILPTIEPMSSGDLDSTEDYVTDAIREGASEDLHSMELFLGGEIQDGLSESLVDVISMEIHFGSELDKRISEDLVLKNVINMELFLTDELNNKIKGDVNLEEAISMEKFLEGEINKRLLETLNNIDLMPRYLRNVIDDSFIKATKSVEADWKKAKAMLDCKLEAALERLDLVSSLEKICESKKIDEDISIKKDDNSSLNFDEEWSTLPYNSELITSLRQNIEENDVNSIKRLQSVFSQGVKLCEPSEQVFSRKPKMKINNELDSVNNWLGLTRLSEDTAQEAKNTVDEVLKKARKGAIPHNLPKKNALKNIKSKSSRIKDENKRPIDYCTKDIEDLICYCGAISEQYKDDIQLRKMNFALGEQERNLQTERERKIEVLKRYEDLKVTKKLHDDYLTYLEIFPKEFNRDIKESVKKCKRGISCGAVHLLEVIMPKFYDVFDRWCYAKHCEYFLNQMAPKEWRIKHDHVFYNQFKGLSDTEKSTSVPSSKSSLLEYVPYKTTMEEDPRLQQNIENAFNCFKRDIEMRGQFVPVPKPYFETVCKLHERLQKIELKYENEFRTAVNSFVIGRRFDL